MRLRRSEWLRAVAVAANDGIVGSAGVLQGIAGAGASSTALLIASTAALVAGSVATFGAQYAQTAAERDAQRALIADELREPAEAPQREVREVAVMLEQRGVPADLAARVAAHMHEKDPLAAQLETEYGIRERLGPLDPVLDGLRAAFGFALGSALPLALVIVYPAAVESTAIFVAVLISLALTSGFIALSAGTNVARALVRTVGIGGATMAISYLVGSLVF